MLVKEIKTISSTKKDLREFGLIVGVILAVLGGYSLLWGRGRFWPVIVGGILILAGLILPRALKPFQKIWMALAIVLGFLMSRIILTLLFFLIITPLGLGLRLFGKKLVELDFDRKRASYWRKREAAPANPERYLKQF